jgi:hypothetical protein
MTNNITSLRNRAMAKCMREIADQAERDSETKLAYAIFVDAGDGEIVMSGDGFRDAQAALRYFTAFMRGHGFAVDAHPIEDDEHEDV